MTTKRFLFSLLIIVMILTTFISPVMALEVPFDPAESVITLDLGETLEETITLTLPANSSVAKADIYLLADSTGSMGPSIEALQANDVALVDEIMAAFPEADLRFGVGDFKDFLSDPYAFKHEVSMTNDIAAVKNGVNNWFAYGGGDFPEGQFFAYDQLAEDRNPLGGTIGWRPDARKILVVFGDAPGHDPIFSITTGLDYDITEASVTEKMVDAGIVFIGISINGEGMDRSSYPIAAGQATRIAEATGGVHLIGVSSSEIVDVIKTQISNVVTTINEVRLVPEGEITPFVASISPDVVGPLVLDTEHILSFDVNWEGTVEAQEEDQVFTGKLNLTADGVVIGFKTVEITVPGTGAPPPPPPDEDEDEEDEPKHKEEGAWGEGEAFSQRGNWAMFFEVAQAEDEKMVPLMAGKSMKVGDVTISRNAAGDELIVTYSTEGLSTLKSVHLDVRNSFDAFPVNRGGNPQIGLFQFSRSFDDGVNETTFYVDLSQMEGDLFIAAHADVLVAEE